jgi:hypothetical protein
LGHGYPGSALGAPADAVCGIDNFISGKRANLVGLEELGVRKAVESVQGAGLPPGWQEPPALRNCPGVVEFSACNNRQIRYRRYFQKKVYD